MINTLLKRRMENTKKNKKGFTLVELIVVLVIIAILAAVLIPTMSGYISRARKTAAQSGCTTEVTAYSAALTDLVGDGWSPTADAALAGTEVGKTGGTTLSAYVEKYGGDEIDSTAAKGAKGKVKSAKANADGALIELVYIEGNYQVTYSVNASTNKGSYTIADAS